MATSIRIRRRPAPAGAAGPRSVAGHRVDGLKAVMREAPVASAPDQPVDTHISRDAAALKARMTPAPDAGRGRRRTGVTVATEETQVRRAAARGPGRNAPGPAGPAWPERAAGPRRQCARGPLRVHRHTPPSHAGCPAPGVDRPQRLTLRGPCSRTGSGYASGKGRPRDAGRDRIHRINTRAFGNRRRTGVTLPQVRLPPVMPVTWDQLLNSSPHSAGPLQGSPQIIHFWKQVFTLELPAFRFGFAALEYRRRCVSMCVGTLS